MNRWTDDPQLYWRYNVTVEFQKPNKKVTDNANLYASHLANFSGNWNNGDNAGPFQFNVNQSTSNSNANIGTHQMFYSASKAVVDPPFPAFRFIGPGRGFDIYGATVAPPLGETQKAIHGVLVPLKVNFQDVESSPLKTSTAKRVFHETVWQHLPKNL